MSGEEIICPYCEAEFYIETADSISYCPQCGEQLDNGEEPIYMGDDEMED